MKRKSCSVITVPCTSLSCWDTVLLLHDTACGCDDMCMKSVLTTSHAHMPVGMLNSLFAAALWNGRILLELELPFAFYIFSVVMLHA
jgi:hypothetical protein